MLVFGLGTEGLYTLTEFLAQSGLQVFDTDFYNISRIIELKPDAKVIAFIRSKRYDKCLHREVHKLFSLFPDNIGIWNMNYALNNPRGKRSILDFTLKGVV